MDLPGSPAAATGHSPRRVARRSYCRLLDEGTVGGVELVDGLPAGVQSCEDGVPGRALRAICSHGKRDGNAGGGDEDVAVRAFCGKLAEHLKTKLCVGLGQRTGSL